MRALGNGDPSHIGAYRLLGLLGEGGMGRVYLGRSEGGRTVALKVVQSEIAQVPDFRRRFAREVAAARRVAGPWTTAVLDADVDAAVPWVATQYVPGPDLHTVVSRDFGPLPEGTVGVLANRLALALQAIHGNGLIHRDLKPTNILVTVDGPRVIDFGIARALDSLETIAQESALTRTGMVIGSPGFMSPEQARGRDLTPASDVFCLGSVLAYAATGRQPFGADGSAGLAAQLFRVVEDEPDLEGVPAPLAALVRDCLEKDPQRRPTPGEIAERAADKSTEPWLPGEILQQLGRRAGELLDYDPAVAVPAVQALAPIHAPTFHTPAPPPALPTMPAQPPGAPLPPNPRQRRTRTIIAGAVAAAVIAAAGGLAALKPWDNGNDKNTQGGKDSSPGTSNPTRVAMPSDFNGTWEGRLTEPRELSSKRLVRIEIQPRADRFWIWTVDAERTCDVEVTALKVTKEFNDKPALTLSAPKLSSASPASEKGGCTRQPTGKLIADGEETLRWKFGEYEVRLYKKPKPAVMQQVPSIFVGHRKIEHDDRGFSPDRRLQLQTVTINEGTVLNTSTVRVSVLAGKPGAAGWCYYRGLVFSVSGEKQDMLSTTTLKSESTPDATPCPASLPAQYYFPGPKGSYLLVSTMGQQGVSGTVVRADP
ncbi:serine/threonine-protein kinase [Streptomyces sp. NPDC041068]|uniref:serine/threonine-protein kinase n=1 Tax=Streptomyces sp. NPDC041068 TaxID=3155130 RepID=UPI0033C1A73D